MTVAGLYIYFNYSSLLLSSASWCRCPFKFGSNAFLFNAMYIEDGCNTENNFLCAEKRCTARLFNFKGNSPVWPTKDQITGAYPSAQLVNPFTYEWAIHCSDT